MLKTTVLFIASLALVPCMGCGVPLMVAAVPCVGSGENAVVRDRHGERIHADGLLLIRRCKEWGLGRSEITARVAEVRTGTAHLPSDWVAASIWLPFAGASWVLSMALHSPIHALLSLPVAVVPGLPIVVPVGEGVELVPLIPGYSVDTERTGWGMVQACGERVRWVERRLTESRDIPKTAVSWWRNVRSRLRRPSEAAVWDAFRFARDSEYRRVLKFVDDELKRLQGPIEVRPG